MSHSIRNALFWFLHTRIGLLLSIFYRIFNQLRSAGSALFRNVSAISKSREFVNFTYHLNKQSRSILPQFVAQIAGCSPAEANAVIVELEQDRELADYYSAAIRNSDRRWASDEDFRPGRILLHYALVRLTKPRCVFEAGLDKGLGAIIINRALQKNRSEGYDARYIGVEYRADRPAFLLEHFPDRIASPTYASWYDVIVDLPKHSIDFLFYDAVTYPEHLEKLVSYSDRVSTDGLIVSAWSHPEIIALADRMDRYASVFAASPEAHWAEGIQLCVFHRRHRERLHFQDVKTL